MHQRKANHCLKWHKVTIFTPSGSIFSKLWIQFCSFDKLAYPFRKLKSLIFYYFFSAFKNIQLCSHKNVNEALFKPRNFKNISNDDVIYKDFNIYLWRTRSHNRESYFWRSSRQKWSEISLTEKFWKINRKTLANRRYRMFC